MSTRQHRADEWPVQAIAYEARLQVQASLRFGIADAARKKQNMCLENKLLIYKEKFGIYQKIKIEKLLWNLVMSGLYD